MNSFTESIPLRSQIAGIFLLTLMSSVVYFNSLKGAFHFDDRNLLSKEWVANLESYNKSVKLSSYENRPVLLWTFAVNNQLDSKHTFGFHIVNLLLHVLVTILIFFILVRVQYYPINDNGSSKKDNYKFVENQVPKTFVFPYTTALIFALHPINTDSVTYISSRSSLLATFFFLLTLYLFTEMLVPVRKLKYRMVLGLFTIPGIYFAVASKLIAVTLPIILILWFLIFYASRYYPNLSKHVFSFKFILAYGCFGIFLIVFSHFFDVLYLAKDQGLELFGRIPYLLVQIKVVVFYYLKHFFLPFNLNVDSGFPFSKFLTDWKILFSILLIAGIILMVLKWGNMWIKLGSAWFLLTLAPTSTFVPLNDLAVEHRMYLPISLGLCLLVGLLISYFSRVNQLRAFIFLFIIFGLLTITRNKVWVSEIDLWSDAAFKNPNSPRVHNNLGKAFFESGNLDAARVHLEKSVSSIPRYIKTQYNIKKKKKFYGKVSFAEPHYNLASVYLDLGRLDDAEIEYEKALVLKPTYYSAELGIGSVKNRKGQYNLAIGHFLNSIELMRKATGQSDYAIARLNLGEVYGKTRRFDQAIIELKRAIEVEPSMVAAHFNLGTAYMLIGENDKAENSFKTCLNFNPNYKPALFNLAQVYQKINFWKKSNNMLKKFLKIQGPNPAAYSAIAWNNIMAGKLKQAKIFYEKTLDLKPNHQGALVNLARIYYRLGKKEISRSYLERALKLDLSKIQANEMAQLLKKLSAH